MTAGDLVSRLVAEGLEPSRWSNGPGERYGQHEHRYDKVIVVEAGSISFGVPSSGEAIPLAAGDRLELPAATAHDAVVGPTGVTCLEAHLPSGSLAGLTSRVAGAW